MANNSKRYVELLKRREKIEGTKIVKMLLNLSTSQYVANENYKELHSLIIKLETDLQIWDVKKRAIFESLLWELSRRFQNYLSSIYSLIMHTCHFCDELGNNELKKIYSKEVAKLRSYDCVLFVRDLRTFSQHIGLPLVAGQISMSQTQYSQRIILQKEELLKWSKWHSVSRKYIKSKGEIDIRPLLEEYQFLNSNFYDWFHRKVSLLYEKQLSEFKDLESELAKLLS
jgi:hypothetical protein